MAQHDEFGRFYVTRQNWWHLWQVWEVGRDGIHRTMYLYFWSGSQAQRVAQALMLIDIDGERRAEAQMERAVTTAVKQARWEGRQDAKREMAQAFVNRTVPKPGELQ